jgi:hypothetical protein
MNQLPYYVTGHEFGLNHAGATARESLASVGV